MTDTRLIHWMSELARSTSRLTKAVEGMNEACTQFRSPDPVWTVKTIAPLECLSGATYYGYVAHGMCFGSQLHEAEWDEQDFLIQTLNVPVRVPHRDDTTGPSAFAPILMKEPPEGYERVKKE